MMTAIIMPWMGPASSMIILKIPSYHDDCYDNVMNGSSQLCDYIKDRALLR